MCFHVLHKKSHTFSCTCRLYKKLLRIRVLNSTWNLVNRICWCAFYFPFYLFFIKMYLLFISRFPLGEDLMVLFVCLPIRIIDMLVKTVSSCGLNYACEQYVNILRQWLGPYFTRPNEMKLYSATSCCSFLGLLGSQIRANSHFIALQE